MTTATLPRRPAAELTERDRMIAEAARVKAETARELAARQPALDQAKADCDALDEPRRRLERLGNEHRAIAGTGAATVADLRRQIEAATPVALKNAIADTRALVAIRPAGPRRERVEDAVRQLEALTYVAGDVAPAIRQILSELSEADLEDVR